MNELTYQRNLHSLGNILAKKTETCQTRGYQKAAEVLTTAQECDLELSETVFHTDELVAQIMPDQVEALKQNWIQTNPELYAALSQGGKFKAAYLAETFFEAAHSQLLFDKNTRRSCEGSSNLLDEAEKQIPQTNGKELNARMHTLRGNINYERAMIMRKRRLANSQNNEEELPISDEEFSYCRRALTEFTRAISEGSEKAVIERADVLEYLANGAGLTTESGRALAKLAISDYETMLNGRMCEEHMALTLGSVIQMCEAVGELSIVNRLGDAINESTADPRLKIICYKELHEFAEKHGDVELQRWYAAKLREVEEKNE